MRGRGCRRPGGSASAASVGACEARPARLLGCPLGCVLRPCPRARVAHRRGWLRRRVGRSHLDAQQAAAAAALGGTQRTARRRPLPCRGRWRRPRSARPAVRLAVPARGVAVLARRGALPRRRARRRPAPAQLVCLRRAALDRYRAAAARAEADTPRRLAAAARARLPRDAAAGPHAAAQGCVGRPCRPLPLAQGRLRRVRRRDGPGRQLRRRRRRDGRAR
mmetsp:Transcript_10291/g.34079  ORF Transcript_10291/g.34079 Transcript_10291/m.34079 type:complete len:221 (+) Transcript_10291:806-1468(+)